MAISNSLTPKMDGLDFTPALVIAAAAQGTGNSVPPLSKVIKVTGVATNADDFIVLPSLASCSDGHEIVLLCSADSNFEMRTPASSTELINNQDCDGTKEYLCTDTQVVKIVKINNTVGWMAHGYSAIGAVVAAVIPD